MSAAPTGPAPTVAVGRWATAACAGAILAGAGHLLAALDHLAHDPRFVAFFLVVGAAQLVAAPMLRDRPRPAVVAAALAGTIGLVLLYVVSRTVALELGPHSDRPEAPDLLGTLVVVGELITVVALPALQPPRWRRVAVNAVLFTGIAVWVSWFAGVLG